MTEGERRQIPDPKGAAPGGEAPHGGPAAARAAAASAAWLSALEALAPRIGHDLRNALNGVAVNLEVVRGRSARGAEASAIAPFAATAAAQFEVASAAVEALLALARPEAGSPDVVVIAERLARLFSVHGGEGSGALRVTEAPAGGKADVPHAIVRAAMARSVLGALTVAPSVTCEIAAADDIFVRVSGASVPAPPLDPALVEIAAAYGVRITDTGAALELHFPALRTDAPRHAPA